MIDQEINSWVKQVNRNSNRAGDTAVRIREYRLKEVDPVSARMTENIEFAVRMKIARRGWGEELTGLWKATNEKSGKEEFHYTTEVPAKKDYGRYVGRLYERYYNHEIEEPEKVLTPEMMIIFNDWIKRGISPNEVPIRALFGERRDAYDEEGWILRNGLDQEQGVFEEAIDDEYGDMCGLDFEVYETDNTKKGPEGDNQFTIA